MESVSTWTSYRPRRYTPLLEVAPQLNSTCNWKSSNLDSLISSGPFPGLTKLPFSTFHTVVPGPAIFHPVKSLPLNNGIGLPHFGALLLLSNGAFRPVHFQVVPFGAFTVPDRIFPISLPSKTMSSGRSSSSLGETKVRWPFEISTLGSGLALPQRPTISAFNCPPSWRSSSHEGYSRSAPFSVKSQRPRKDSTDLSDCEEEIFPGFPPREYTPGGNDKITITRTNNIRSSLIEIWIPSSLFKWRICNRFRKSSSRSSFTQARKACQGSFLGQKQDPLQGRTRCRSAFAFGGAVVSRMISSGGTASSI